MHPTSPWIHLFVVFFHFCANEDVCTAAGAAMVTRIIGAHRRVHTHAITHARYDYIRF